MTYFQLLILISLVIFVYLLLDMATSETISCIVWKEKTYCKFVPVMDTIPII